ncbi:NUDIX hydrolase [Streptomyces brevispora]|uniref:NUDIX hydrolase n=1 Tax=Streptomyces brevispora TaxID=887462 RepID=UPI0034029173
MSGTVRAAGCVLWRRPPRSAAGPGGATGPERVQFCLVHRPRYDDWSFPKGKLKRGESPRDAALREVLEETGHHCVPGAVLPMVRYLANGRPKEVTYWSAEATAGAFVPNREVDDVLWLPSEAARARLTHPRDRALLDRALPTLPNA